MRREKYISSPVLPVACWPAWQVWHNTKCRQHTCCGVCIFCLSRRKYGNLHQKLIVKGFGVVQGQCFTVRSIKPTLVGLQQWFCNARLFPVRILEGGEWKRIQARFPINADKFSGKGQVFYGDYLKNLRKKRNAQQKICCGTWNGIGSTRWTERIIYCKAVCTMPIFWKVRNDMQRYAKWPTDIHGYTHCSG